MADRQPYPHTRGNQDHRRANAATTAAAKAGGTDSGIRARTWPANSISIAGSGGGRPCRRQTVPSAPAQSRSPPLANPAASGRSNSMSRRPGAPHLAPPHRAQTPPRRSPASARCSTAAAARGRPVPRRLPLNPSLAPVQTPLFAPLLTNPINSPIARRSPPDGYPGSTSGNQLTLTERPPLLSAIGRAMASGGNLAELRVEAVELWRSRSASTLRRHGFDQRVVVTPVTRSSGATLDRRRSAAYGPVFRNRHSQRR